MGWLRAKFAWNLVFAAGDAWTIVRWLEVGGLTMDLRLGPPEYAALLVLFTGGLVGVNWKWIRALSPLVRFGDLEDEAMDALLSLKLNFYGSREAAASNSPQAHVSAMAAKLTKLKVPHPPPKDLVKWLNWLPQLLAWVKTKNLRSARRGSTNFPS